MDLDDLTKSLLDVIRERHAAIDAAVNALEAIAVAHGNGIRSARPRARRRSRKKASIRAGAAGTKPNKRGRHSLVAPRLVKFLENRKDARIVVAAKALGVLPTNLYATIRSNPQYFRRQAPGVVALAD